MKTKTYDNPSTRQTNPKYRFGNVPGNMVHISPRAMTRQERRALVLLAASRP
jgi:hypothetical protein